MSEPEIVLKTFPLPGEALLGALIGDPPPFQEKNVYFHYYVSRFLHLDPVLLQGR